MTPDRIKSDLKNMRLRLSQLVGEEKQIAGMLERTRKNIDYLDGSIAYAEGLLASLPPEAQAVDTPPAPPAE